jgi:hypothetical protein
MKSHSMVSTTVVKSKNNIAPSICVSSAKSITSCISRMLKPIYLSLTKPVFVVTVSVEVEDRRCVSWSIQ